MAKIGVRVFGLAKPSNPIEDMANMFFSMGGKQEEGGE